MNKDKLNKIHELKTWSEYFQAIMKGEKNFEFRLNDRNFQIGDRLDLMEYDSINDRYTGAHCHRWITYILNTNPFMDLKGHVILSLSDIEPHLTPESKPQMTAEAILYNNLNESSITFINTYPVAFKSDKMLKDWIIEAMEDFAEQQTDHITELFAKPLRELRPLQDLWRKENSPDKFIIPDATEFYKWIVGKVNASQFQYPVLSDEDNIQNLISSSLSALRVLKTILDRLNLEMGSEAAKEIIVKLDKWLKEYPPIPEIQIPSDEDIRLWAEDNSKETDSKGKEHINAEYCDGLIEGAKAGINGEIPIKSE